MVVSLCIWSLFLLARVEWQEQGQWHLHLRYNRLVLSVPFNIRAFSLLVIHHFVDTVHFHNVHEWPCRTRVIRSVSSNAYRQGVRIEFPTNKSPPGVNTQYLDNTQCKNHVRDGHWVVRQEFCHCSNTIHEYPSTHCHQ